MAEETWTDDPTALGTPIKAVHNTELQDAIDAYNTAYGQGAAGWTHDRSAEDAIEDTEWDELQAEIDVIGNASTKGAGYAWDENPCAAGDVIDSVMIEEIRDNMNDLQANYCITCDSCDTHACDCDIECNADACDLCDSQCYEECSCDTGCYNDVCDQCDATGHVHTCTCDGSCNGDCGNCTICATCNNYHNICGKQDNCGSCHHSCYNNPCDRCHGSCYSEGCTSCNPGCDGDACDACDAECYEECSCDTGCHNNVCDTCDGSCNVHSCSACDAVNYRYPWT